MSRALFRRAPWPACQSPGMAKLQDRSSATTPSGPGAGAGVSRSALAIRTVALDGRGAGSLTRPATIVPAGQDRDALAADRGARPGARDRDRPHPVQLAQHTAAGGHPQDATQLDEILVASADPRGGRALQSAGCRVSSGAAESVADLTAPGPACQLGSVVGDFEANLELARATALWATPSGAGGRGAGYSESGAVRSQVQIRNCACMDRCVPLTT
jgi:hypothetical protein